MALRVVRRRSASSSAVSRCGRIEGRRIVRAGAGLEVGDFVPVSGPVLGRGGALRTRPLPRWVRVLVVTGCQLLSGWLEAMAASGWAGCLLLPGCGPEPAEHTCGEQPGYGTASFRRPGLGRDEGHGFDLDLDGVGRGRRDGISERARGGEGGLVLAAELVTVDALGQAAVA